MYSVHTVLCKYCTLYKLYTLHCKNCTLCTLYNVHYTHCTLYTLYIVHTMHCTYCTLYTLYIVHTVHTVTFNMWYWTYDIVHCKLYTVHCTLYSEHYNQLIYMVKTCSIYAYTYTNHLIWMGVTIQKGTEMQKEQISKGSIIHTVNCSNSKKYV